jgi:hypothetical protein
MRLFFTVFFFITIHALRAQSNAYWQQEVNYTIQVELNDQRHTLTADLSLDYVNHSPDTLREIFFHLWPNAYKGKKSALAKNLARDGNFILYTASANYLGGIDSLDFMINGTKASWSFYKDYLDIAVISLAQPLAPGSRVKISTPFRVKIPSGSISRLGHIGESYQITQWYPKPAVYDKNGWHPMPYLNQGEFYSEFGSFDVSITLPENYTIGATGDCQTASEIERMNQLSRLPDPASAKNEFPKSAATQKTVRYIQKNVHDFGWFADKRWVVRKGFCVLPTSKDTVTTWALYTPENASTWNETALQALRDGLYYYSLWSGDYPYKQCTAVDGTISAGGGMEYPNVTVIGSTDSKSGLATVIIHEVGHNWFYGILGSNERDNAWMDEGLNSFFETRTLLATKDTAMLLNVTIGSIPLGSLLGLDKLSYQYTTEELFYLISARYGSDQSMQLNSEAFTDLNYGGIVYKKTSLVFNYLMQFMGEDLFNRCMKGYFEEWKFKHPQPEDLQAVFEKYSGKDLDWLFKEIIRTNYRLDFAARRIRKKQDGYHLTVANVGEAEGPFGVEIERDGKTIFSQWYDPIKSLSEETVKIPALKGDVIHINRPEGMPEFNRHDNFIRTRGVFRGMEPLKLGFFTTLDKPNETQINFIPIVGWNDFDHWMLGVNLHTKVIPRKKVEWSLAPMYSIASQNLTGFANFNFLSRIVSGGVRARSFGYERQNAIISGPAFLEPSSINSVQSQYGVINPYLDFNLVPSRKSRKLFFNLRVDFFYILSRDAGPNRNTRWNDNNVSRIRLTFDKKWTVDELSLRTDFLLFENENFGNQNTVTYRRMIFPRKKKKLHVHGFFSPELDAAMPKGISGQTGLQDFTYEGLFFGRTRTEGLLSRQINSSNGGILAPTALFTRGSMYSLSAELDMPVAFPLGIYGSFAGAQNVRLNDAGSINGIPLSTATFWSAGVTVPIARGIFQVWFPVVYSSAVSDRISQARLGFFESFMFELNVDLMNPFSLVANLGR